MKIVNGIAVLESDECISKWVVESGRLDHDQNMLPLVLDFIPVNGFVIDIGAYIGDHTIAYSKKVGLNGKVIAIEPNKEAYDCLVYNLQYRINTLFNNCGIGSENKTASVTKVTTNDGMNYLSEGNDIDIYTIDHIFEYSPKIDFIKIDCEGYELDVLNGGEKVINKYKPVMLIEINELTLSRNGLKRGDIFNWLTQHNYKFRNIYKKQGLDDYQLDIICEPL